MWAARRGHQWNARMRRGKGRVGYPPLSPWRGQREGLFAMPWRHERSRVGHCRTPRRERQGKGQPLLPRLDLWLRPRREQGQPCQSPLRERQGNERLLLLSLGLWLRSQGGQGRH